jgi:hypothetical protein
MTTNKKGRTRAAATVGRSRRGKARKPALQVTSSERHTHWTCPVCRAIGTVDHAAGSSGDAISALRRTETRALANERDLLV